MHHFYFHEPTLNCSRSRRPAFDTLKTKVIFSNVNTRPNPNVPMNGLRCDGRDGTYYYLNRSETRAVIR